MSGSAEDKNDERPMTIPGITGAAVAWTDCDAGV